MERIPDKEQVHVFVDAITEVLIDALRFKDKQLNNRVMLATLGLGPDLLPALNKAVERGDTRPAQRKRLQEVIRYLEIYGQHDGNVARAVVFALVDTLRIGDKQLTAKAKAVCSLLSADCVSFFVAEATRACNRPAYCVRLLETVDQFPALPGVMDVVHVTILTQHSNQQIREAAMRVLVRSRSRRDHVTRL